MWLGRGLEAGEVGGESFAGEDDVGEFLQGFLAETFVVRVARGVMTRQEPLCSARLGYVGSFAGCGMSALPRVLFVNVKIRGLVE